MFPTDKHNILFAYANDILWDFCPMSEWLRGVSKFENVKIDGSMIEVVKTRCSITSKCAMEIYAGQWDAVENIPWKKITIDVLNKILTVRPVVIALLSEDDNFPGHSIFLYKKDGIVYGIDSYVKEHLPAEKEWNTRYLIALINRYLETHDVKVWKLITGTGYNGTYKGVYCDLYVSNTDVTCSDEMFDNGIKTLKRKALKHLKSGDKGMYKLMGSTVEKARKFIKDA